MIKAIIGRGIGFSLGTTSYIPTHGFSIGILPTGPTIFKLGLRSRLSKKNQKVVLEVGNAEK